MLLAAELARPSAVLGPVDFFAFCLLASIWACVDMVASILFCLEIKNEAHGAPLDVEANIWEVESEPCFLDDVDSRGD